MLVAVTACVVSMSPACGPRVAEESRAASGAGVCEALDAILTDAMPARPWTLRGHATFDVEDYRVRGRFRLEVLSRDAMLFEFEGTTLFGGHREDVAVTLTGETLRVLDRERGVLYEGTEVDDLVWKGTGTRGGWTGAIREVAGLAPGCDARSELSNDGEHVSGLTPSGAFVLTLDAGRLVRAWWPDPTSSRTYSDRLDIRYQWDAGALRGVAIALPVRGWRIRLESV
jgi:hypothetical protein